MFIDLWIRKSRWVMRMLVAVQGDTWWDGDWQQRDGRRTDGRHVVRFPCSSCQRNRSWRVRPDQGAMYTAKFVHLHSTNYFREKRTHESCQILLSRWCQIKIFVAELRIWGIHFNIFAIHRLPTFWYNISFVLSMSFWTCPICSSSTMLHRYCPTIWTIVERRDLYSGGF